MWLRTSRNGRASQPALWLTTKGFRQQKKPRGALGVRAVSMALPIKNGKIANTNVMQRVTTTSRLTFTSRIGQQNDGGTTILLQPAKAKAGRGIMEGETLQSILTCQGMSNTCRAASNGLSTLTRMAPSSSYFFCNRSRCCIQISHRD